MPYYAVAKGRHKGVYNNWSDCKDQVSHYSGAEYKKFGSYEDTQSFANGDGNRGSYRTSQSSRDSYHSYRSSDYSRQSGSGPVVYTDGACSKNGMDGAKGGIGVHWGDDHPDNVSRPLHGRQTNNRAEIEAAITAIEQAKAKGYSDVTVVTDSKFLHDSATQWMDNWKSNGWRLSGGGAVKNREDFQHLQSASKDINVHWKHIPAHEGYHGNEAADKLAKSGMNK